MLGATPRFQVVRCIGAGGAGTVYEAVDVERNARVALKTLHAMDGEALLRFKREFRDFQNLRHPNLVSVGELLSDGAEWFFSMELVEGTSFLEYVPQQESIGFIERFSHHLEFIFGRRLIRQFQSRSVLFGRFQHMIRKCPFALHLISLRLH